MSSTDADDLVITRLEALVAEGERVLATWRPAVHRPGELDFPTIDVAAMAGWQARARNALIDILGDHSSYLASFDHAGTGRTLTEDRDVKQQTGVLRAVLADAVSGHLLRNTRRLVAAEIYSNLVDQAAGLHKQGYDLAAAAVCGAALESGLRTLCDRFNILVRPGDDISALNTKLAQAGHITAARRKEIQYWAGVRSVADHGRLDEFTPADVGKMVAGVQSFLSAEL